jgi:hypothetical protein
MTGFSGLTGRAGRFFGIKTLFFSHRATKTRRIDRKTENSFQPT